MAEHLLIERELTSSIENGRRVTLRIRDTYATGYLIGMDSTDYLLVVTEDALVGKLDPPLLLIVSRRACLVVQVHTISTLANEEEDVQGFVSRERDTYQKAYVPAQRTPGVRPNS